MVPTHQRGVLAVRALIEDDVDPTPRRHADHACVIPEIDANYRHLRLDPVVMWSEDRFSPALVYVIEQKKNKKQPRKQGEAGYYDIKYQVLT